jgi:hypothetical protein
MDMQPDYMLCLLGWLGFCKLFDLWKTFQIASLWNHLFTEVSVGNTKHIESDFHAYFNYSSFNWLQYGLILYICNQLIKKIVNENVD